jgi:hypothetical protein
MDSSSQPTSSNNLPSQRLPSGCPFLGLREDSDTHFSTPSPGNYCHKVKPTEPIHLNHQESSCLSDAFPSCRVFSEDWRGPLPEEIRGIGSPGVRNTRSSPASVSIVKPQAAELSDSYKGINELSEIKDISMSATEQNTGGNTNNVSDPADSPAPWNKLYDEAKGNYKESNPKRKERIIWAVLLVVATLVLFISLRGVFSRVVEFRSTAEEAVLTARAVVAITATQNAAIQLNATQTAQAALLVKETEQPTPTSEVAMLATASAATAQAALEVTEAVVSCDDFSGYAVLLVEGPELSPRQGYIYVQGDTAPPIQATWKIQNVGNCKWEQILVKDVATEQLLVPTLLKNGSPIDLANFNQAINPGDEIAVILSFNIKDALTIDRQWLFSINGFNLAEQPPLTLKVQDWVVAVQGTPSQPSVKPTSTKGSGKPGNNDGPTRP